LVKRIINMNKTLFNDIGFLSSEYLTNPALQQISSSDCYKICENLDRAAQTVLNHKDHEHSLFS